MFFRRQLTSPSKAFASFLGILIFALPPESGSARTLAFSAVLCTCSERPAINTGASGAATFTFDTDTLQLNYTITFEGLSSPVVTAEIGGPETRSNGTGKLLEFPVADSPIAGTASLDAEEADALQSAKLYLNVRTDAHPAGELRGQIEPQQ